jgi:hypothetical protein
LRVQNEGLEGECMALKSNRDMQIGLNEERKLKQLKINIDDASRRSQLMEDEVENII